MDYSEIAESIFARTKYVADEEDTRRLAHNMALLEKRRLSKLNERLIDNPRGTSATLAEHNFAVILASEHSSSIPISYEPDIGSQRPPDFRVVIEGVTYWIQIKDLARLERENRQDKVIREIERAAKEIKVSKFFDCKLSDDFKEGCLPAILDFIKDTAAVAVDGEEYPFVSKENQKARIKFWSPREIELSELTLGSAGDLGIVQVTGLSKGQIKQSLLNAVGAFDWEVDRRNINLIVMEADNKHDIDVCDSLFGTESDIIGKGGHAWTRADDGLFDEPDFSNRIAGVIAIKRKPEKRVRPVGEYRRFLYLNSSFDNLLEDIKRLLSLNMVIYYDMRPPMGQGNFDS